MIHAASRPATKDSGDPKVMVKRLLDGLALYRYELGEVGLQLELLLRCAKTLPSDQDYLRRLH